MIIPGEVYQTRTGERLKIVDLIGNSVSYYRRGSGEFCTRQTPIAWFEHQQYKLVIDRMGFPVH